MSSVGDKLVEILDKLEECQNKLSGVEASSTSTAELENLTEVMDVSGRIKKDGG